MLGKIKSHITLENRDGKRSEEGQIYNLLLSEKGVNPTTKGVIVVVI